MNDITDREIMISNLRYVRKCEATLQELRTLAVYEFTLPAPPTPPSSLSLRELARFWRRQIRSVNDFDTYSRVALCRRLFLEYAAAGVNWCQLLFPEQTHSLSPEQATYSSDPEHESELNSIKNAQSLLSYVQNPYSDEALLRLCGTVPQVHACRSFSELSDDISSGISDSCVIPIENTSDGKLMSFYSIIDRLELKIIRTCDIESSDGSQATRYALLARNPSCPKSGGEYYLELSMTTDGHSLSDLLSAASRMNLCISRIDSVPQRYDESILIHYPVLRGQCEDLLCFMLYIELERSDCTLLGMYNNV